MDLLKRLTLPIAVGLRGVGVPEGTFARRAPGTQLNALAIYPNALPPNNQSLQPSLPDPCRLGGPRVGGLATSPLPSQGSPTRDKKWGKGGDLWGTIRGKLCLAQCRTLPALHVPPPPTLPVGRSIAYNCPTHHTLRRAGRSHVATRMHRCRLTRAFSRTWSDLGKAGHSLGSCTPKWNGVAPLSQHLWHCRVQCIPTTDRTHNRARACSGLRCMRPMRLRTQHIPIWVSAGHKSWQ